MWLRPDPPQRCALCGHRADRIRARSHHDLRRVPRRRPERPKTAV